MPEADETCPALCGVSFSFTTEGTENIAERKNLSGFLSFGENLGDAS
jgi:hypothetical protein